MIVPSVVLLTEQNAAVENRANRVERAAALLDAYRALLQCCRMKGAKEKVVGGTWGASRKRRGRDLGSVKKKVVGGTRGALRKSSGWDWARLAVLMVSGWTVERGDADLTPVLLHDFVQPGLRMLQHELEVLGGEHARASAEVAELLQQSDVSLAAAGIRKGFVPLRWCR